MNNILLQLKIKERLNKVDSDDDNNLFCWQIQEAFNKAQREWVRRQIDGINQKKEGRESSAQKIADLQQLLVNWTSTFVNKGLYYESCDFPTDYLVFSRISSYAVKKGSCCPPRKLVLYLAEESKVDIYLKDVYKRPSWEYGESFYTLFKNTIRIYTNKGNADSFDKIKDTEVIYYREPRPIKFKNCIDSETGLQITTDVTCEFSDTITELIIDDAAAILSFDLENAPNGQRNQLNEQHNT